MTVECSNEGGFSGLLQLGEIGASRTRTRLAIAAILAFPGLLVTNGASARDYLVHDRQEAIQAIAKARAGDRIVLDDGDWRDFDVTLTGSGANGKPIVLTARTPGGTILSGRSAVTLSGDYLEVSDLIFRGGFAPGDAVVDFSGGKLPPANHSRLTGVTIEKFSKPTKAKVDHWVVLAGTHNRIDHNAFTGKTNGGPTLIVRLDIGPTTPNHHRIDHNYFGPRPAFGGNGAETIRVGTSREATHVSATAIERNLFDRCDGEIEIISLKSRGNVVRENTVLDSQGSIVMRHGGGNRIERNVFFGNGIPSTGGIRVTGDDQTVTGNYLETVKGEKFLAAMAVMNGEFDGPANGYQQVVGAQIVGNTLIDVGEIGFKVGADQRRPATPARSLFGDNLVAGSARPNVLGADNNAGLDMTRNVLSAQVAPLGGALAESFSLKRASNGLLYPYRNGVRIEVGAPFDLEPVVRSDVGPAYAAPAREAATTPMSAEVSDQEARMQQILLSPPEGGVLRLGEGAFLLPVPVTLSHPLTIVGQGPDRTTILMQEAGGFTLGPGASLALDGLTIKPRKDSGPLVRASAAPSGGSYDLSLHDVSVVGGGSAEGLVHGTPGSFAGSVSLSKVSIKGWSGPVVSLPAQEDGAFLANRLTLENSSFADVAGPLVLFGRHGLDESAQGPILSLRNLTLSNVANNGIAINADSVDAATVEGVVVSRSGSIRIKRRTSGGSIVKRGNTFDEPRTVDIDS